jgi:hypothetical protein
VGIRLPFLRFEDKKSEANFRAIHGAATIRVVENVEQSSAPIGERKTVIIYAVDNGLGKLKLMAQFPSGAAQQLSIEP